MKYLSWLFCLGLFALGCSSPRPAGGACELDAHCAKGLRCCAGVCRDVLSDPDNCGNCGASCSTANATPTCRGGVCEVACSSGFGDCNKDTRDGCEQQLADPSHCGACGRACSFSNASASCGAGQCALRTCDFGHGDCDSDPTNGCETDTRSSAQHCGACNKGCAPANGTGACSASSCQIAACNSGFDDCNVDPNDGCETHVRTSMDHCGTCNNPCGEGLVCSNGQCRPRELLVFGGSTEALQSVSDVYSFNVDTKTFTQLTPTGSGPTARDGHVAFWDSTANAMFVWGGVTLQGYPNDLWSLSFETNPPVWKGVTTTGAPAGRAYAAFGYDSERRKLYVFGGSNDTGELADLWILDVATSTWTQHATSGPPARGGPAGGFDPVAKQFVVFGGYDSQNDANLDDLWVFDAASAMPSWTQVTAPAAPSPRESAVMFSGGSPLYLFSGSQGPFLPSPEDFYGLTLKPTPTWTQVSSTLPPGRMYAAGTTLGTQRFLYGGMSFVGFSIQSYNDLWMFDASTSTWTELSPNKASGAPAGVSSATLVARD